MSPAEKKQRTHELYEAYKAARLLEQRLEMCIGWYAVDHGRNQARRIREDIAAELIALGSPMPDFGA